MFRIIKVTNCSDCPYLKLERYWYCKKQSKTCVLAYRTGKHAEYPSEIQFLFKRCPLPESDVKKNIEIVRRSVRKQTINECINACEVSYIHTGEDPSHGKIIRHCIKSIKELEL